MSNEIKHLFSFDQFLLDPQKQLLSKEGTPVSLEPKELALLEYMVRNPGRLLSKKELMENVWSDTFVEEGRIAQVVYSLRKKAFGGDENYIVTISRQGYRFDAEVTDKGYVPDEACPWVGLRTFDERQARYYHGREEEIRTVIGRLKKEHFLAIVGSSGRGKSSLARAGVVPVLRHDSTQGGEWMIKLLRPTHSPLRQLSVAILELGQTRSIEEAPGALVKDLCASPEVLARRLSSISPGRLQPVLLIIDQFEELFSYNIDDQERESFIANVLTAVSDRARNIFVILTIRTDFLPKLEDYPELWRMVSDHQHGVRRLSREELRLTIEKPARSAGLELEVGLVDEILDDLGEAAGALPLLSHTMAELFKRRNGRRLTFGAYRAIGKVRGAIAHHADSVFAALNQSEQEVARHILLRLADVGPRAENDVGRRVTIEDLVTDSDKRQEVELVVRKLADERLLTTGTESETTTSGDVGQSVWVEVSHVALIKHWPRLAAWLNKKRHALRIFHSLDAEAREWERTERDPEALYRGHRLEHALEARESYTEFMDDLHLEFLRASEALKEETQEAERRRQKRKQQIKWLSFTVLLLTFVSAVVARELYETKRQRDLADSLKRAADSISQLSFDPELSLLLAIESGRLTLTRQAEAALRRSLAASRVRALYAGHEKQVISVDLSPDGKHLLTGSLDKQALIWDVATGEVIRPLSGHSAGVNWAAYSPDGRKVVTASRDSTVRIWDADTGRTLRELRGHIKSVNHAIFSPDGSRVLTAGEDHTARVWDAETGGMILELRGHEDYLNTVAYSPDGRWIVSASGDKTARVWDAQTGAQIKVLTGHQDTVLYVAFSNYGREIVTTSRDRTARVWDVGTWAERLVITGHSLNVNSADFSPDDRFILTASKDGTARVWDAQTGKELLELLGHGSGINTAIFSSDGRFAFTASGDQTVRKWAVQVTEIKTSLSGHKGSVNSCAFSPDGGRLVTAGEDRTVRVWDAYSGRELRVITHPDSVQCAAISLDGRLIATAGNDRIGRVWDAASGELVKELAGHQGSLHSIAFSHDGTKVVTTSADRTARVWDINTGQGVKEFGGYSADVSCATFSPDDSLIATASFDNKVRVWTVATDEVFEWNVETGAVNSVAISSDGKYVLASCFDQTARVWDLRNKNAVAVLRGHEGQVNSAEFSPDGLLVASASNDRTVRLWEFGAGRTLLQLTDQNTTIKHISFSPVGRLIAAADEGGNVKIYDCEICGATGKELLRLADAQKTRDLTPGERARFLTLSR